MARIDGKIYNGIIERIKREGAIHLNLIDPDEQSPERAVEIAQIAKDVGSFGLLVGGSGTDLEATDACVKAIKGAVDIPVILFPGNITGISKNADGIFYMSLLNSRSNYWLSLAQALSAFTVKRTDLEIIPMGYLIIESGKKTSVQFYGDANAIPFNKPKIAAAFSLAAEFMGMKLVYLEAGSGALQPVNNKMISYVRDNLNIPLIVGGGIRDGQTAYEKVISGADIIVTGTVAESSGKNIRTVLEEIVSSIKKAGEEKVQKAKALR